MFLIAIFDSYMMPSRQGEPEKARHDSRACRARRVSQTNGEKNNLFPFLKSKQFGFGRNISYLTNSIDLQSPSHLRWRSQEFVAGYAKYKKIKANTQYNEQLSYHGHNKSIIITSGSLLRAGTRALTLGRRGTCSLPVLELSLPR